MHLKFSLIFISLLLVSCLIDETDENSAATLEVEVEPTPNYIMRLWPEPGSVYTVEEYNEYRMYSQPDPGVCVEYDVQPFLEPGDFLSTEEMLMRFSAEVDGRRFTDPDYVFLRDSVGYDVSDPESGELLYHVPAGGPYLVCFSIELGPGLHSVTFIGTKTSGEERSYSWSFILK